MNRVPCFRNALFLICCLVGIIVSTQAFSAQEGRCETWTSEDRPILTRTYKYIGRHTVEPAGLGLKFETPSFFWERGVWFEMPLGFRNPWIHLPHAEVVTDLDAYKLWLGQAEYKGYDSKTGQYNANLIKGGGIDGQFSFWMPSLRYVERNRWTTPDLQPCEAGRPRPTEDDYVVRFSIDWPFLPDSENSGAANRFRNAEDNLRTKGRLPLQDISWAEHSLNGPISGDKDYFIYSDDGDLVVQLSCTVLWGDKRGDEKAPNGGCSGDVWQRSSDLILFVFFPEDKGQRGFEELWREPVMAAIHLASEWRMIN